MGEGRGGREREGGKGRGEGKGGGERRKGEGGNEKRRKERRKGRGKGEKEGRDGKERGKGRGRKGEGEGEKEEGGKCFYLKCFSVFFVFRFLLFLPILYLFLCLLSALTFFNELIEGNKKSRRCVIKQIARYSNKKQFCLFITAKNRTVHTKKTKKIQPYVNTQHFIQINRSKDRKASYMTTQTWL